jgi:hypothetical protein
MTVFISYSRLDETIVTSLIADIKQCGEQPWLDDQLRGGEEWWNEILHQIRECRLFIFCLSDNSMSSKPCQSELHYARQLGLPIIPVQVGEFSSMRAFPLAEIQSIDYRSRSSSAGLNLANAMRAATSRPVQLPSPLPAPPPLPFAYLLRLRAQIEDPQMSVAEQDKARTDLLNALEQEDSNVHPDILSLIRALRRRGDITHRNAEELDRVLRSQSQRPKHVVSNSHLGQDPTPGMSTTDVLPPPPRAQRQQSSSSQPPPGWPPGHAVPPYAPPPRKRRSAAVIVGAVLAVIALGGALALYINGQRADDNWRDAANYICRQADDALSPLVSSTPTPASQALPEIATVFRAMDQALRNLDAPDDIRPRIALMTTAWDHVADAYDQMSVAVVNGDYLTMQEINAQQAASNSQGNQIANDLGLGPCAGVGTGVNLDFTR